METRTQIVQDECVELEYQSSNITDRVLVLVFIMFPEKLMRISKTAQRRARSSPFFLITAIIVECTAYLGRTT